MVKKHFTGRDEQQEHQSGASGGASAQQAAIISLMIPADNPLLDNLRIEPTPGATTLVIFGASGDLTARKLIPAVYNLSYDNLLPADFFLVGYGRKPIPDDEFRGLAADAIKEFDLKPYPSIDGLRNMQRLLAMQNPRLADVNPANLLDATFIRKLDESGFLAQLQARYRD